MTDWTLFMTSWFSPGFSKTPHENDKPAFSKRSTLEKADSDLTSKLLDSTYIKF